MSWNVILHLCVFGKLSHAQISPFTTITNYSASLQPLAVYNSKAVHGVLQFCSHVYSSPHPSPPPPHATSWFLIIRRQGNGPLHRITGWFLEEANFSFKRGRYGLSCKNILETGQSRWYCRTFIWSIMQPAYTGKHMSNSNSKMPS